ncbi:MAG: DUF4476 domain-containing protein, partial [Bacteroidia bacterium]|nr:DUF4476 domain-containing protein [Bacteroidia bacterium]
DLPEIKDKIHTIWEGKPTDNMEFTYVIEKKGSGYRMRFLSAEEIAPKGITDSTKLAKDTVKIKKRECKIAMKENDFIVASQAIGSRNSEDSRILMAKNLMSKNCFNCKQLKDVCDMFEYDKSRVDFLKEAYDFCTDRENFRDLIGALDYKASKKEFEEWMLTKP